MILLRVTNNWYQNQQITLTKTLGSTNQYVCKVKLPLNVTACLRTKVQKTLTLSLKTVNTCWYKIYYILTLTIKPTTYLMFLRLILNTYPINSPKAHKINTNQYSTNKYTNLLSIL